MLLAFSGDGRGMAAPPTLEKHTMWEAVPPGDSSARHGGQRKLIALGGAVYIRRRRYTRPSPSRSRAV
jgi:hypothetical protein